MFTMYKTSSVLAVQRFQYILYLHVTAEKFWHCFLVAALQVSWGILLHTESFTWSGKNIWWKRRIIKQYQLADLVGHSLTLSDWLMPVELDISTRASLIDVTLPHLQVTTGTFSHFCILTGLHTALGTCLQIVSVTCLWCFSMCVQFTISTISYHRANLVGKDGALGLWFLPEGESIAFPKFQKGLSINILLKDV